MRIVSFFKRALKLLFKLIFSKKFLLSAAALLVLLVTAVSITHHFYNKHAWKHWDDVSARATVAYELGRDDRFHRVLPEKDFFLDPFVKEYFKKADLDGDSPLRRVRYMDLLGTGEYTGNYKKKSVQEWLPDREFETGKEAAIELLSLLDKFEGDVSQFERLIYEKSSTNSNLEIEVTLENFEENVNVDSMRLISLTNFFNSRGKLYILSTEKEEASRDLSHCMQVARICENGTSLADILVHQALIASVKDLVSYGIQRHAWDENQLSSVQAFMLESHFIDIFREFPASEFTYNKRAVDLIQVHGMDRVNEAMMNETPSEGSEEFEFSEFFENILTESFAIVTPEGLSIEGVANTHEYMLDIFGPELQKGVSIEVLESLFADNPESSLSEELGLSSVRVFKVQYEELIKSVTLRRMVWLACEIEKHYLVSQEYPSSLSVLQLADESLLNDPYSNGRLSYSVELGEQSFELFSKGVPQGLRERIGQRRSYRSEDEIVRFFSKE